MSFTFFPPHVQSHKCIIVIERTGRNKHIPPPSQASDRFHICWIKSTFHCTVWLCPALVYLLCPVFPPLSSRGSHKAGLSSCQEACLQFSMQRPLSPALPQARDLLLTCGLAVYWSLEMGGYTVDAEKAEPTVEGHFQPASFKVPMCNATWAMSAPSGEMA